MRGTAQNCRLQAQGRDRELKVSGAFPDPPEWLQGVALDEWRRVQAISDYAVCIKASDRGILAAYCVLYAELAGGELRASMWPAFVSLSSKLGMTPSDRSKVRIEKPKKQENPFAKFA